MHAVTSQTVTATAVRNNRSTVYEVGFQGDTYSRIAFREYRWATVIQSRNGLRRVAWSNTNHDALHPAGAEAGDEVLAVVLLAQPEVA
jgi:hypothetical protein